MFVSYKGLIIWSRYKTQRLTAGASYNRLVKWNVARLFLELDYRKSLCSFQAVNKALSSATCGVSMIKT